MEDGAIQSLLELNYAIDGGLHSYHNFMCNLENRE